MREKDVELTSSRVAPQEIIIILLSRHIYGTGVFFVFFIFYSYSITAAPEKLRQTSQTQHKRAWQNS
ncbi:MAG: hypothetical protein DBX36_01980 [Oscillospiraceae bacterium]|nr:MAG: hypothetical protein DBX36_01980 [Oscillospiraceae bacterium]